jgi:hypothetical protein
MDIGQQGRILQHQARSEQKERRADTTGVQRKSADSCVRPKAGGTGKYCAVKDEKGNLANAVL